MASSEALDRFVNLHKGLKELCDPGRELRLGAAFDHHWLDFERLFKQRSLTKSSGHNVFEIAMADDEVHEPFSAIEVLVPHHHSIPWPLNQQLEDEIILAVSLFNARLMPKVTANIVKKVLSETAEDRKARYRKVANNNHSVGHSAHSRYDARARATELDDY